MLRKTAICLAISCAALAAPAQAADFSDPTWPCIQRKVEDLSLGIMWPHPVPDIKLSGDQAAQVNDLVDRLSLRRVTLEEADQLIRDFAADTPDLTIDLLGNVFKRVFDKLGQDRKAIIQGIGKYSISQLALSQQIDDTRSQMTTLMAASEPDFDKVDELEEKLDWDERIYRDRAKSLTYVCETPVLLEKRIYAIAQSLLQVAPQ
ncbi:hypothetical protein [Actibacterium lipolyticum]|uniref:Uncharacterized protein n=1 Tax=Actibacterium lipolyticum TaxID=1524263 RepID=A0A238JPD6_9RHOB|nr:hypothetical protein [Actibacterium lipolyticum]SMX32375.1 hypothetical protein COL8621_00798 [Actibacterium lipolyticum]